MAYSGARQDSYIGEEEAAGKEDSVDFDSFGYRLQQQIIEAWKPVPNACGNLIFVFDDKLFGEYSALVCIGLGLGLVLSAPPYDDIYTIYVPQGDTTTCPLTHTCQKTVTLSRDYPAPVYLYYSITNFYQNHRNYLKYFSSDQLKTGKNIDLATVKICNSGKFGMIQAQTSCGTNFATNQNMGWTGSTALDGVTPLVGTDVAFPCGVRAYYFMKMKPEISSFSLSNSSLASIPIRRTGIAWPDDTKNYLNYDNSKQVIDVKDENFLVWFRPGAKSDASKLFGVIDSDLVAGDYTFHFTNNFDATSWGDKRFIISKSNFVGNRYLFLGGAFLGLGGLAAILFIIFCAKVIKEQRSHAKPE